MKTAKICEPANMI